jgi:hypothetical protein
MTYLNDCQGMCSLQFAHRPSVTQCAEVQECFLGKALSNFKSVLDVQPSRLFEDLTAGMLCQHQLKQAVASEEVAGCRLLLLLLLIQVPTNW